MKHQWNNYHIDGVKKYITNTIDNITPDAITITENKTERRSKYKSNTHLPMQC